MEVPSLTLVVTNSDLISIQVLPNFGSFKSAGSVTPSPCFVQVRILKDLLSPARDLCCGQNPRPATSLHCRFVCSCADRPGASRQFESSPAHFGRLAAGDEAKPPHGSSSVIVFSSIVSRPSIPTLAQLAAKAAAAQNDKSHI